MDLPLDIQLLIIKSSSSEVFHFKNKNYSAQSPAHYHIALPVKDDSYILFVMFTSQTDKKIKHYNMIPNSTLRECLVFVEKGIFPFIITESLIDCNEPIYVTKEELKYLIEGNIQSIPADIPDDLIEKLKSAVRNSPMVKPFIKENLQD